MNKIKIYLYDDKENPLLANADVTFEDTTFGPVTIKGFQIWRSQFHNKRLDGEKINIEPPSTKPKYDLIKFRFVHLDDEEMWFKLMGQIFTAYKKEVNDNEVIV